MTVLSWMVKEAFDESTLKNSSWYSRRIKTRWLQLANNLSSLHRTAPSLTIELAPCEVLLVLTWLRETVLELGKIDKVGVDAPGEVKFEFKFIWPKFDAMGDIG